jgi:hypothetical protein
MNLEKLEKLAKLKEMGAITEEEYNKGKKEAMGENGMAKTLKKSKFGLADKDYYVLMHLSQYSGMAVPILGIIVPIVLWVINKDNDPLVDAHGRNILNWNISLLIYFAICFLLVFLFIGFILIWIPCILMIVYPIIGAAKASNGEVWKYPLSIKFL